MANVKPHSEVGLADKAFKCEYCGEVIEAPRFKFADEVAEQHITYDCEEVGVLHTVEDEDEDATNGADEFIAEARPLVTDGLDVRETEEFTYVAGRSKTHAVDETLRSLAEECDGRFKGERVGEFVEWSVMFYN